MSFQWSTRRRPAAGRPRLGALLAVAVGVLLTLAAGTGLAVLLHATSRPVDAGTLPSPAAVPHGGSPLLAGGTATGTAAGGGLSGAPVVVRPAGPPLPPVHLQLPALGIDAPVAPVGVTGNGVLGVPDDVHTLGWWNGSAPAGAASGTTVIDGHVDSATTGPGALFRLAATPIGATLTVTTPSGRVRYTVAARRAYPKASLPADLFTRTGPPQLVVITCGGAFNTATRHYTDNVIVYATPA